MERIAVIGAGLMGHGIAQAFAVAGHPVRITDTDPAALESVHARVERNLEQLGADTAAALAIEPCGSLDSALEDAEFVFEAAVEDLELKQSLFERISRLVAPDTVLATNTSVISIGEIGARALDPSRVVGTHWWNPPYLIPLVEVVPSDVTGPGVAARTIALLEGIGKEAVLIRRDIPGFVGNRLQHALWREAIALVDAGVCDGETIDRVVKASFGARLAVLGPIENADLVGLDLTLAIHEYVLPHLDRTPGPAPLLRELVERGDLGMKTGTGFRTWTEEEARDTRERVLRYLAARQPLESAHAPEADRVSGQRTKEGLSA